MQLKVTLQADMYSKKTFKTVIYSRFFKTEMRKFGKLKKNVLTILQCTSEFRFKYCGLCYVGHCGYWFKATP
jgi:hypothetical protein